ncbi:hypothetical protein AN958_04475 [Leucoagaricus sp. SymC.cos]|nr:hypothetical protein AN958_04475 [Leucoagaricus sp. SymC.cos]
MENGNLVKYLKDFPESPRRPLLFDVMSGLHYLHSRGIIHENPTAKQVLVSEKKRAVLSDSE